MRGTKFRRDPLLSEENWKAFEYEVKMFCGARKLMRRDNLGQIAKNAALESALLHTRILVEALLSRGKKGSDITLADLLPIGKQPPGLCSAIARLDRCYGHNTRGMLCWTLNKRLAHLTKERGDSYDYWLLFEKIDPLVQEVLRIAIPLLQRPELERLVANRGPCIKGC